MKHYELLYIVAAKFAGAEMETIQDKVKKIITEEGGQIDYEEDLGKKKFAYQIKHNSQGFYTVYEFDLEPDKLKIINNKIELNSEVLRHLIISKDKISPEEREKFKSRSEGKDKKDKSSAMTDQFNIEKQLDNKAVKQASDDTSSTEKKESAPTKPVEQEKTESKDIPSPVVEKEISDVKVKEEKKTEEKAVEEKEAKKEEKDKVKLEDLDKKLDEIIDSNIF